MNQIIQKQNVGNTGEYYIASLLSSFDYTVTITLGRAERFDILALSPNGKLLKLSVKTTQRANAKAFPMSEKDEKGFTDDFFYAFVRLKGLNMNPDVWIIPSKIVCNELEQSHLIWLNSLDKNGKKHNQTNMRQLFIENNVRVDFDKYKDTENILELLNK